MKVYIVQKAYEYDNVKMVTTNLKAAQLVLESFKDSIDGILHITEHEVIV